VWKDPRATESNLKERKKARDKKREREREREVCM